MMLNTHKAQCQDQNQVRVFLFCCLTCLQQFPVFYHIYTQHLNYSSCVRNLSIIPLLSKNSLKGALTHTLCFLNAVCCESCSDPHKVSLCARRKHPLSILSFLFKFKISPTLLITHSFILFTLSFFHSVSQHQHAGMLGERPHYGGDSSLGVVFKHEYVAALLGEIPSTLKCPCGGNTKAELCSRVWEEKCNNFHLNASTLPNTMGLSFTGIRPPCIQSGGLQGSRTNEAAGISLAPYKLLCVKPFSGLEAAPGTSYYFSH